MSTFQRVLAAAGLTASCFVLTASPAPVGADSTCTGTRTGARFDDNLIIPEGAACTLVDSTVRGNVVLRGTAYFQATGTNIRGNIAAADAQTIFVDTGSSVDGNIQADRTAQVHVFGATIAGNVEVRAASDAVMLCSSTVRGNISISASGRDILVGDPLTVDCAGNTVRGNVVVERSETDVELMVRGNTIDGNLTVSGNQGSSAKAVESNRGRGNLECRDNGAPFTGGQNVGWAQATGQCASTSAAA